MNKNNNLEKNLPDMSKVFTLDIVGSVTKKRFLGEFECKIPTIQDQSLMARHEASLNGEYGAFMNAGIKHIHKQLSYLKYTLDDVPKFWKDSDMGFKLMDYNVIDAVYTEVLKFEDEWLAKIWGDDKNPDGKEEESEEDQEETI